MYVLVPFPPHPFPLPGMCPSRALLSGWESAASTVSLLLLVLVMLVVPVIKMDSLLVVELLILVLRLV